MSILNKYNKSVNPFNYEQIDDPEYLNLKDLYEEGKTTLPIYALFINTKGYYGDSPVAVTDVFNINLPGHLLDTVKEMIEDEDVVNLANSKRLGIEIYEYTSKRWGKNYSVNFIELENEG